MNETYTEESGYGIRVALLIAELVFLCAVFFWILSWPVGFHLEQVQSVYEGVAVSSPPVRAYSEHILFGDRLLRSQHYALDWKIGQSGDLLCKAVYDRYTSYARLKPIAFDHVEAEYTGRLYMYDKPKVSDIDASAFFEDGYSVPVEVSADLPKEVTGNTKVSVHTDYADTEVMLVPITVREVRAKYNQSTFPGDKLSKAMISVEVVFADNKVQSVSSFDVTGMPTDSVMSTDAVALGIDCKFGHTDLTVAPAETTGVTVLYPYVVKEGEKPDPKRTEVLLNFKDGSQRTLFYEMCDFSDLDKIWHPSQSGVVRTQFGDGLFSPEVNAMASASMVSKGGVEYRTGDTIDPDHLVVYYVDGTSDIVSLDDIEKKGNWEKELKTGRNKFKFVWREVRLTFYVEAKHPTPVMAAQDNLKKEIEESYKTFMSDNTFVTVRRYRWHDAVYYLTHVIVNSPEQVRAGLSYDDYAGERETPTSASKRLGWVVGVNGGNFSYATGGADTHMARIVIKNSEKMSDSGSTSNGMEICLTANGKLFSPWSGASVSDLLSEGVTDTFTCGDTLLIDRGKKVNVGIQSEQYRYPRTAVGMVEPGEYYIITAGVGDYEGGMSYDEVRDVLYDHGCVFGKCMDGGGSSSLVFENELLNPPATGSERPVADFFYFVDIDRELDDSEILPHAHLVSSFADWSNIDANYSGDLMGNDGIVLGEKGSQISVEDMSDALTESEYVSDETETESDVLMSFTKLL